MLGGMVCWGTGCCCIVGLIIFLPILFTCTLEDADEIDNIGAPLVLTRHPPAAPSSFVLVVSTMCNFTLKDEPYWLCQRQDAYCVENQTCECHHTRISHRT